VVPEPRARWALESQQTEASELRASLSRLQQRHEALQTQTQDLQRKYQELESSYQQLQQEHSRLQQRQGHTHSPAPVANRPHVQELGRDYQQEAGREGVSSGGGIPEPCAEAAPGTATAGVPP